MLCTSQELVRSYAFGRHTSSSCCDGKRSRCVNGRQQQKVVTRAESGVLSFDLGLEMSLKAPTHPPCYSCGEEFKELTAVN